MSVQEESLNNVLANDILKRLDRMEQKMVVDEILQARDVELVVEDYLKRNVCSFLTIGISVVSWACMAT